MRRIKNLDKEQVVKIIFFILSCMLITAMFSCSSAKKFQRIIKEHPEYAKTKIEYRDTSFNVPGKKTSDEIKENIDTAGVDKITGQFKGRIDTVLLKEITHEVKTYIVKENQNLYRDTSFVHGRDTIFVNATARGLRIRIAEGDTTIAAREKFNETDISPSNEPWHEQVHKFWRKFRFDLLIAVAVFALFSYSWRQLRGK